MKIQSSKFKVHAFAALILGVSGTVISAQTGDNFDLSHNVIASGGGKSAGTSSARAFTIEGTIGQGFAGTESSSTPPQLSVRGGFWGFLQPLPTAAAVSIAGRVLTPQGRGLATTLVTLTSAAGERRTTTTNPFGFYRFEGVEVGQTYIVAVLARRFIFTPQTVVVGDEISGLNFVAVIN